MDISENTVDAFGNSRDVRSWSRSRSVAFAGLSVALIAVSAWLVIPIGPIPVTLQMLVIPLLVMVLPTRLATAAVIAYVLFGAVGFPVFSGMRGGPGVLLGPTGGFLLAYLVAVPVAGVVLSALRRIAKGKIAAFASDVASGLVFTAIAYIGGWLQYSAVAGIGMEPAFAVAVAPFIIPDIVKVAIAAYIAQYLKKAIA